MSNPGPNLQLRFLKKNNHFPLLQSSSSKRPPFSSFSAPCFFFFVGPLKSEVGCQKALEKPMADLEDFVFGFGQKV